MDSQQNTFGEDLSEGLKELTLISILVVAEDGSELWLSCLYLLAELQAVAKPTLTYKL